MKVICISGHAQHGKDTSAQMMRSILWGYGKKVLIIHNADLLKYMCRQLFSWNGEKDDYGRTLLQYVGTDVVRSQKPDFWIDYIADVLELFHDEWDYVMIPDCRFPNEIDVLRNKNFDVIHAKVVRENFDNGLSEEQKHHPSETALDNTNADVVISNNGTLADLMRGLMKFIVPIYNENEFGDDAQQHTHEIT